MRVKMIEYSQFHCMTDCRKKENAKEIIQFLGNMKNSDIKQTILFCCDLHWWFLKQVSTIWIMPTCLWYHVSVLQCFCLQYDTHRVILSYEVIVMTGIVFMIVYCKYHKNTSIYKSPHNTNFIKRTTKWGKVSKLWHFIYKNFISRSAKINQRLHFLWYMSSISLWKPCHPWCLVVFNKKCMHNQKKCYLKFDP